MNYIACLFLGAVIGLVLGGIVAVIEFFKQLEHMHDHDDEDFA